MNGNTQIADPIGSGRMDEMRRTAATLLQLVAIVGAVALGGKVAVVVLLAAGTIVLALRRGRWIARQDGDAGAAWAALGGAVVGAAALAGAWWMSPAVLDVTGRTVEWTTEPVVRGSVGIAATVMAVTLALGVAAECIFRRWILDDVAAWVVSRGEPRQVALAAGVLVAAMIEAAVSPAGGGPRIGTFLGSLGLGAVYVASGGRLAASLGARLAFELGALLLQAMRWTP